MPETNLQQDRVLETKEIGIEGMTCDHCVRKVDKTLRAEEGVAEVKVDRETARAVVTYDTRKTDIPRLHEAIRKAGYGVPPGGKPLRLPTHTPPGA